ncbi:N-acyl homoserine lactonase family protein [Mesorhizobium sp. NZP2298]|uniref:N-acyl homoserine lactonase family protein n=1 Tax=Mesorhizobium sp. NZP2298 TaxID=2483403 RepID=UPI0015518EFE|nr:N-acyl homoserine lactonase family protein [Mesorhizobium sp. NZP2298]QKC98335.1 N-acyl homoserine lactonase family protein [Mesorhizobium sp. NZP2298]
MPLTIYPLNLGEVMLDASFLVLFRHPGTITRVPCYGYLIMGGEAPVLVDSGFRDTAILASIGMVAEQPKEMTIEHHLSQHGLRFSDIRHVVHTHAHIDHAGGDDRFPMTTTVCLARRELEFAVSGVMGPQYPLQDTKHLIDRLHTPCALRLFDVDGSFEEEVIPGVAVRLAGGHTPGSLSVMVETSEGVANICGDILYDFHDSLVSPLLDINDSEPTVTGNHAMAKRDEKTAIKKAMSDCRFLLPGHDRPALIEHGKIAGRLEHAIPGPVIRSLPSRVTAPAA